MKKSSLITALMMVAIALRSHAADPGTPPRAIDQSVAPALSAQLGEDTFEHRYQAAVATGDEVFVAVKRRLAGASSGAWQSSIWRIDPSGKILDTVDLNEPNQPPSSDASDVVAMSRMADGTLACALLSASGELRIAQISGKDVTWSLGNKTVGANLHIVRMFATSDGDLMLLGHRNAQATYIKVTLKGIPVWERKIPDALSGVVFDGVPNSQGGGFIVADFWTGDPFMVGESWIMVAKIGANGEILAQTRLRGRRPRLTRSDGGGPVLVYDKGDSAAQQIVVEEFSEALEPVWTTPVLANERGLETFKVDRLLNGGYAVVGGDDLKLFACAVDASGRLLWSFRDPRTQSADFNVFTLKQGFLMVYPVVSITEIASQRKLNTKLGITRFDPAH